MPWATWCACGRPAQPVSIALPIVNGGFEADGAGDGAGFTPTGWTKVSGDWDVHDASNGDLSPAAGSFYLEGGNSASGELAQTIDLVACGLDPAQIDADAYRLDVSVSRANSFPDDLGRVIVEALDGATNVLTTILDTGFEAIVPEDSWVATRRLAGPASLGRAEPADPAAASAGHRQPVERGLRRRLGDGHGHDGIGADRPRTSRTASTGASPLARPPRHSPRTTRPSARRPPTAAPCSRRWKPGAVPVS